MKNLKILLEKLPVIVNLPSFESFESKLLSLEQFSLRTF